jgi:curved DNA-binding protein CbpA
VARDLYTILGVAHDADFDTIRAAYRNAAKTAHPDLGGTAEEFEALKEAYDCLSDETRRANYDRYYTRGKAADTLDAKALDKLRTTIVGIVNFLGKREENKGDHPSEADQLSMLVDGTLIDAVEWQINK